MDSIAVIKPNMTVARQESLSPFGMLTQVFTEELVRRNGQAMGTYRPLRLAYLEEDEAEQAAPPEIHFDFDVNLLVNRILRAERDREKSEKEKKTPEQRILERVILREKEIRIAYPDTRRLVIQMGGQRITAELPVRPAEQSVPASRAGRENSIPEHISRQTGEERGTGAAEAPRRSAGLKQAFPTSMTTVQKDVSTASRRTLTLASQAMSVPAGGGWTPTQREAHPGYPTARSGETKTGGADTGSILLPDVLRRRREAALENRDHPESVTPMAEDMDTLAEALVWGTEGTEQNSETETALRSVRRAVLETLRKNEARTTAAQGRLPAEKSREVREPAEEPLREESAAVSAENAGAGELIYRREEIETPQSQAEARLKSGGAEANPFRTEERTYPGSAERGSDGTASTSREMAQPQTGRTQTGLPGEQPQSPSEDEPVFRRETVQEPMPTSPSVMPGEWHAVTSHPEVPQAGDVSVASELTTALPPEPERYMTTVPELVYRQEAEGTEAPQPPTRQEQQPETGTADRPRTGALPAASGTNASPSPEERTQRITAGGTYHTETIGERASSGSFPVTQTALSAERQGTASADVPAAEAAKQREDGGEVPSPEPSLSRKTLLADSPTVPASEAVLLPQGDHPLAERQRADTAAPQVAVSTALPSDLSAETAGPAELVYRQEPEEEGSEPAERNASEPSRPSRSAAPDGKEEYPPELNAAPAGQPERMRTPAERGDTTGAFTAANQGPMTAEPYTPSEGHPATRTAYQAIPEGPGKTSETAYPDAADHRQSETPAEGSKEAAEQEEMFTALPTEEGRETAGPAELFYRQETEDREPEPAERSAAERSRLSRSIASAEREEFPPESNAAPAGQPEGMRTPAERGDTTGASPERNQGPMTAESYAPSAGHPETRTAYRAIPEGSGKPSDTEPTEAEDQRRTETAAEGRAETIAQEKLAAALPTEEERETAGPAELVYRQETEDREPEPAEGTAADTSRPSRSAVPAKVEEPLLEKPAAQDRTRQAERTREPAGKGDLPKAFTETNQEAMTAEPYTPSASYPETLTAYQAIPEGSGKPSDTEPTEAEDQRRTETTAEGRAEAIAQEKLSTALPTERESETAGPAELVYRQETQEREPEPAGETTADHSQPSRSAVPIKAEEPLGEKPAAQVRTRQPERTREPAGKGGPSKTFTETNQEAVTALSAGRPTERSAYNANPEAAGQLPVAANPEAAGQLPVAVPPEAADQRPSEPASEGRAEPALQEELSTALPTEQESETAGPAELVYRRETETNPPAPAVEPAAPQQPRSGERPVAPEGRGADRTAQTSAPEHGTARIPEGPERETETTARRIDRRETGESLHTADTAASRTAGDQPEPDRSGDAARQEQLIHGEDVPTALPPEEERETAGPVELIYRQEAETAMPMQPGGEHAHPGSADRREPEARQTARPVTSMEKRAGERAKSTEDIPSARGGPERTLAGQARAYSQVPAESEGTGGETIRRKSGETAEGLEAVIPQETGMEGEALSRALPAEQGAETERSPELVYREETAASDAQARFPETGPRRSDTLTQSHTPAQEEGIRGILPLRNGTENTQMLRSIPSRVARDVRVTTLRMGNAITSPLRNGHTPDPGTRIVTVTGEEPAARETLAFPETEEPVPSPELVYVTQPTGAEQGSEEAAMRPREKAVREGPEEKLPAWARELLEQNGTPGTGQQTVPFGGTMNPESPRQITWTAPGAGSVSGKREMSGPAEITYKEPGQAAENNDQPAISDAEIQRTADRVYRLIEERLRRELRRSGR